MTTIEILLLALALAMDAFAVSICKGLSSRAHYLKTGLVCGLWFGFFQALMPFLGWLLGSTVADYVERFSAYIAFALLAFLGIKMIVEAVKDRCECCCDDKHASLAPKVMVAFAIATSIDALAAGLTLAAVHAPLPLSLLIIGVTTFLLSFIAAAIGAKFGSRFKTGAEVAG
ncbi:MAG: manganese efflux pump, partial [Clostridia bacterium]|nr:manganese efflux pump [Clostridia bacterium]